MLRLFRPAKNHPAKINRVTAFLAEGNIAGYLAYPQFDRGRAVWARLAVPGEVDLFDLAAEAEGVANMVVDPGHAFEAGLDGTRQRRGQALRPGATRPRRFGHSINKADKLAGCSPAQGKRIWAEVSQDEAAKHAAFVESAIAEADALAASQDERQEERK